MTGQEKKAVKNGKMSKRERHNINVAQRAALHREKQSKSDPNARDAVQRQIDEMSRRT